MHAFLKLWGKMLEWHSSRKFLIYSKLFLVGCNEFQAAFFSHPKGGSDILFV